MDTPQGAKISLETLSSVAQTLDSLLKPGFGPLGRSTLLTTSTGQVLITNVGASVLECLNIYNPIGRMITSSLTKCQIHSGDGSKTFVLYLAAILSHITSSIGDSEHEAVRQNSFRNRRYSFVSACRRVRQKLLQNVIMPAIDKSCVAVDIRDNPSVTVAIMSGIVDTHLSGKYPTTTRSHLAQTLVNFICHDLDDFDRLPEVIEVCLKNFHLLCVETEGRQPSSTHVINGILIQKEFLYVSPTLLCAAPVNFVVMHLTLDRSDEGTSLKSTFMATNSAALNAAVEWKTRQATMLVSWLKAHRVDLILCSKRIDEIFNGLCSAARISTAHFVDAEELHRIEVTFGISAVNCFSDILDAEPQSYVGSCERCEPTTLGGKQFVYLGMPVNREKPDVRCQPVSLSTAKYGYACPPRQLIACGMSAGACRQVRINLCNSMKVLRAWTDGSQCLLHEANPSVSVPVAAASSSREFGQRAVHISGGGTFELAVCRSVQSYLRDERSDDSDESFYVVCRGLCAAMTAVPVRLIENSYRPHQSSVANIDRLAGGRDTVIGINGRTGKRLQSDSTVIEPLAVKVAVLSSVLELTEQLLRLDRVLSAKRTAVTRDDC
jgi:chaperonin GroEL (HSP60 family)